jgi:hypothetical protein
MGPQKAKAFASDVRCNIIDMQGNASFRILGTGSWNILIDFLKDILASIQLVI